MKRYFALFINLSTVKSLGTFNENSPLLMQDLNAALFKHEEFLSQNSVDVMFLKDADVYKLLGTCKEALNTNV